MHTWIQICSIWMSSSPPFFIIQFRSFLHGRGQDFIPSDLIVAIVRNPIWRSSKHKAKEQNQLSKKSLQFLCWGSVSMSFNTAYDPKHYSPLSVFPQWIKKSYIIPDDPERTKCLKPHLTGLFGLYCLISLIFCFGRYYLYIYWG